MRVCRKCGVGKPELELTKEKRSRRALCLACENKYRTVLLQKIRLEVLTHYSEGKPRCKCCGETAVEFLAVDHKQGGGGKHRKELGVGNSTKMYRWIKNRSYPEGFRVLCHNCNFAVHFYKVCPHQRLRGK